MTTVIIIVLCLVLTAASAYMASAAVKVAEESEHKLNELQSYVDSHVIGIENDIRSINRSLSENEYSHGVLSMRIQEISKLDKTNELRKEVLHTRG